MGSVLATIASTDPSLARDVTLICSTIVAPRVYRRVRQVSRVLRQMTKGEVLEVKWVKHGRKMELSVVYRLGPDEDGE
jgi:hypothetical protein